jgi:hypothetical protein
MEIFRFDRDERLISAHGSIGCMPPGSPPATVA